MNRNLALTLLLFIMIRIGYSQSNLSVRLNDIARSVRAEIGVAIKNLDRHDTASLNINKHLPMQSVFKLPLVMYALHLIDSGILKIDQKVLIKPEEYFDTWSPIMKQYPNANVALTIDEIIMQTLKWSDNIGCDVLFRVVGGPKAVSDYIHAIGIKDIAIVYNEREMHADWKNQFENWCTPSAMLKILERVYNADLLSKKSHNVIWTNMRECALGKTRLRGQLPPDTEIAHRTGTGGTNDQNIVGAVNDVGIIKLPNGEHLAVVVFTSNSPEEYARLEEVNASVAKAAYDYHSK